MSDARHSASTPGYASAEPSDHAQDLAQRLTLVHPRNGIVDVSGSSSAPSPLLQHSHAALQHPHHSEDRTRSNRKAAEAECIRLEKRRARNRASQRKARQKLREERATLQGHLAQLQQRISRGRADLASLQRHRVEARKRLTSAISALAAAGCPRSGGSCPGSDSSCAGTEQQPPHPVTPAPPAPPVATRTRRTSEPTRAAPASALAIRTADPPRTNDAALPPSITSFPHHASISYDDIRHASEAAAGAGDGQRLCMRKVLEQCMFRKAWAAGWAPGEVCWFVQTQYEVAPGVPLSYSTTLSTPECIGSMALHFLASCLEFSLFVAMDDHSGADYKEALLDHLPGVSLGVASKLSPRPAAPLAPRAPQQDKPHSTQHASPRRRHKAAKRSTLPPLHGSPRPWADGAATCDTPGTDPFHDSRPRVSPPEGVSRSTGSGATEASPTPSGEKVPAGEHWSGAVRCGVNATCAAHAALAAIVLAVQRTFHGHVSVAELKWAFNQTASHLDDLLFATFAPSVTEGGGHVSGVPLAADTEATRFHGAITEAMACLLPGMHKLLLKLPDSAVEGAEVEKGPTPGSGGGAAPQHPNPQQASPARAPTATTAGDLQRHADVIMTLYSSGHLLVLKDANRIVRNMSVNGTRTMIQQFEVENMHMRVYRSLQLSEAQREAMRGVWLEWEKNRRCIDTPVATARACLAALPPCIPLPPAFAQHVFAVADGTVLLSELHRVGPCVLEHPGGPAPWLREPVVPLLGAAQEFSAHAAEALRLLWYVQEAEIGVTNALICERLQPGRVLSLQQQLRLYSCHLLFLGAPFVDFLALCQHALTHQRRKCLFRALDDPYGSPMRH